MTTKEGAAAIEAILFAMSLSLLSSCLSFSEESNSTLVQVMLSIGKSSLSDTAIMWCSNELEAMNVGRRRRR